jgi:hypothetical protein
MSLNQIITGTVNNILNREEQLQHDRMLICRNCKLILESRLFGEICNSSLCLNVATNHTSTVEKVGFICGCGCILNSKTRVREAHCPVGKW